MASGYGLNGGMWFLCFLPVVFPAQWHGVWSLCRLPFLSSDGHLGLTYFCFSGPSRCYGFWQEVLGCYVVNAGEGETGKKQCMPALEDYYECLHHRKEVRLCSLPPEFEGE